MSAQGICHFRFGCAAGFYDTLAVGAVAPSQAGNVSCAGTLPAPADLGAAGVVWGRGHTLKLLHIGPGRDPVCETALRLHTGGGEKMGSSRLVPGCVSPIL